MTATINPFCYVGPVRLCDRQVWVPDPNVPLIVEDLLSGRCCLIVGAPNSGTTSTLLAVRDAYAERLPESVWWHIDLRGLPTDDAASLYAALGQGALTVFPGQEAHWSHVASYCEFTEALVRTAASLRRRMVLAIDHIETTPFCVAQAVVRGVRALYSKVSDPRGIQRPISVVLAGSRRLHRQGAGYGSPLNFGRIYHVVDLEREAAARMLLSAVAGQPWTLDLEAAHYLAEVTGGDKYLLQRLGYDCVERLVESGSARITATLAHEVVNSFVRFGFQDDRRLSTLLPLLVKDGEALEMLLKLLTAPASQVSLAEMLRADLMPDLTMVFRPVEDSVTIRNEIYRLILLGQMPILSAVHDSYRRSQEREACRRKMQRLASQAELALTDEELQSTLAEIQRYVLAKGVHLFAHDEVRGTLDLCASAQGQVLRAESLPLPVGRLVTAFQGGGDALVRCQSILGQCLSDDCLCDRDGDCSWIPLKAPSSNRLVGAVALVGQSLVLSAQMTGDLLDVARALACTVERRRQLQGLQQLAQTRIELSPEGLRQQVCRVARLLTNKPYSFLWQGDTRRLPIPLRTAVGVQEEHYCELALAPGRALCTPQDRISPHILLVHSGQKGPLPISAAAMSMIGVRQLLLVCFFTTGDEVGVLGIGTPDPWEPSEVEVALARLVAKQAAVALANLHAYQEIRQRLETSRLSLGLLSHELNRLPAAMSEELELLLTGHEGPLAGGQREKLVRVQGYVQRHEHLIGRLLDWVRLQAESFRAELHSLPIRPVLQEALERLTPEVEAAGMRLEVALATDLPSHELDPVLIDRILDNLVRNSVQYAVHGVIRVRAWEGDSGTTVEVEDEGPGVPPEYRDLIFQPWHRGKFSVRIAGKWRNLGLGLYFVRGLMELHGGCAEYDGSYSGGARFRLSFPRLQGETDHGSSRGADDRRRSG